MSTPRQQAAQRMRDHLAEDIEQAEQRTDAAGAQLAVALLIFGVCMPIAVYGIIAGIVGMAGGS